MTDFMGKQTLPPHPHFEHLRKQAKARLMDMRASQPDARLADAQRALARDYGFPTWGALRAEVLQRTGVPAAPTPRQKSYRSRDRASQDAALEQAMQSDAHAAFILSGAGINVGILFVIIAIFMSLWVFTSALPR